MNQQTFALLLSQSDAMGRPLLSQMPQGTPVFSLVGRPVVIATQMPDPGPAQMPEAERTAINAEIKATGDQLARLCALACRAVERPTPDYTDEWIETPREEGEAEVVDLRSRPPDAA